MKKSSSSSKSKRWSPDENPKYSLKKKMASRFLRSMKKMDCSSSPSTGEKGSWRYHAIRAAAYASMASAVGPRKAWSRALLKKIRNHKVMMRKSSSERRNNPRNIRRFGHEGLNDLSQVVPGGKAMDSCSLLTETAHYIKCLAAQVQIMKQILHYSTC
ncbi:hypothetical protein C2S53_008540 [Perilla frutescens var. hirtella]|uniref:IBH1-like N-terminal domain-containing protein n=1 Tax=Perilla frutescens var. hirtella TaxID=608512 RepID=A0AAD4PEC5_PERFH|nr:hypothetical protein C2S51_024375 [Perilla frutescens var. frutescens]KAH6836828.1 hypothetical protein C2S53_008540 [Perilla frutescens var. hirtella]